MADKRRYKGFDYNARDPKPADYVEAPASPEEEPEAEGSMEPDFGLPPDDVADPEPEEEPHADRNPEAGVEVRGEAQGAEGESEEPPLDQGEGPGESES